MGFACSRIEPMGIRGGFKPDNSGIRGLLQPIASYLKENVGNPEVDSFVDEVDRMAMERFGDSLNNQQSPIMEQPFYSRPQLIRPNVLRGPDASDLLRPSLSQGNNDVRYGQMKSTGFLYGNSRSNL